MKTLSLNRHRKHSFASVDRKIKRSRTYEQLVLCLAWIRDYAEQSDIKPQDVVRLVKSFVKQKTKIRSGQLSA